MSTKPTISAEKKLEMFAIGTEMKKEGLSVEFISAAVMTALEFEGVYDLMQLWNECTDVEERAEIVADIQDMIDDCQQKEKVESVYVRFDDLDAIAKNIRAFKDSLREKVDDNGGISKLSELTGIPQPSLSRFFNSASRPRRNTLYRIAKALGLSQVDIVNDWTK